MGQFSTRLREPDADGWENLGSVGQRIQGAHPDFDPRSYGCAKLSTLVDRAGGFDIRKGTDAVHVRRNVAATKGSRAGKASTA
ncbi:MAG: OST-HTH/LOTUS domain-containing protein [Boseongicola sp.]|nr:OST-HTH/LOTUS domain-containing protein [Boseongicola sp.]